jgi:hypothetical protein
MKTRNVDQFLLSGNQSELLELDEAAIGLVSGGGNGGHLAMSMAGGWASTVTGFAVGAVIGGTRGAMIGGAAGFLVGALIGIGMHYASRRSGSSGGGGTNRWGRSMTKPR